MSKYPIPVAPNRELLGFLPPPVKEVPAKPKRQQLAPPPSGWTRTLHASPAAYPRELRDHTGNMSRSSTPFHVAVPPNETKDEQKKRIVLGLHELCSARYGSPNERTPEEGRDAGQPLLFQSVERWRRDKPSGRGKTLVFTHANGLPKEVSLGTCTTNSLVAMATCYPESYRAQSRLYRDRVWHWRAAASHPHRDRRHLDAGRGQFRSER